MCNGKDHRTNKMNHHQPHQRLALIQRKWHCLYCGIGKVSKWSRLVLSDLVVSDSLHGEGNGTPLQYSCLENPMDGGAWWAAVYGVAQSWTWLKWLSSSSRLFATRWTLAYQVPPSMGFSRQNFPGVDCHFLFQDLVNPGIELRSTALLADTLWSEPLWYFPWD